MVFQNAFPISFFVNAIRDTLLIFSSLSAFMANTTIALPMPCLRYASSTHTWYRHPLLPSCPQRMLPTIFPSFSATTLVVGLRFRKRFTPSRESSMLRMPNPRIFFHRAYTPS